MNNDGQRLKALRENAGYSIEILSQVTRINLDYIDAIENNRTEKLPDPFFVKGFIRCICKELKLTGDEAQEIIAQLYPPPTKTTNSMEGQNLPENPSIKQGKVSLKLKASSKKLKSGKALPIFICTALGIALFGLFSYLNKPSTNPNNTDMVEAEGTPRSHHEPASPSFETRVTPNTESKSEKIPAEHTQMAEVEALPSPAQPSSQPSDASSAPPALAAKSGLSSSQVQIKFKEPVKVRHKCDDSPNTTTTFSDPNTTFTFQTRCDLLIFDAGSVEVFLNDQPLGYLGQKGRVRRLAFIHEQTSQKPQ